MVVVDVAVFVGVASVAGVVVVDALALVWLWLVMASKLVPLAGGVVPGAGLP